MVIVPYYALILAGVGVAVFFQVLFVKTKQPIQLVCSIFWLLPICYETWVLNNCTGECNIRVDLMVIIPIELAALAAISYIAWRSYNKHNSQTG